MRFSLVCRKSFLSYIHKKATSKKFSGVAPSGMWRPSGAPKIGPCIRNYSAEINAKVSDITISV